MNRIKIVTKGYETFTGFLGMVQFENAVSVHPVPRPLADRLSALTTIVEVDEEGNELGQAGAAARIVGGATMAAPVQMPMRAATDNELRAEKSRLKIQSEKPPVQHFYTPDELGDIASEKGLKGLREVAEPWGVKDRSIPGLIKEILIAQAQFQKAQEERKAAAQAPRPVEEPKLVQSPATPVEQQPAADAEVSLEVLSAGTISADPIAPTVPEGEGEPQLVEADETPGSEAGTVDGPVNEVPAGADDGAAFISEDDEITATEVQG